MLFENNQQDYGYDHIKRLFRMALSSDSAIHIPLEGPPASAKTIFLTSLVYQLKNRYFADTALVYFGHLILQMVHLWLSESCGQLGIL